MKDKGGEEDETGGVNVAQPTVATTSIPKTGGGQIRPLKLARLENAEERVEEFMEFALEQVASRGSKTVRVASGGVNRIFYRLYRQVKQETARDFDQNNCFDALSKVVSLHDNHAETPRQKEAAQFYFAVVVKQFDKKFASESRAIVAKVRNDQLDAARRAYKDLGDRFGTSRWKEKAQARIARLDQLEEIRSSDGSKDAVAAASAFKGLIGKAASRAKLALRRFDHAKAATAFEGLIKDAPNDELKASAKTQYDAYKLQAEGFERAAQNVTAEAKNKGIKFSEGRIKNADVVGAKPDQLTLKIRGRDGGQIETSIRFVKIEPDRLQETLRKFKLDPQATAGLYVFCVENDLADPAEELKEIALEEGDDAFKESFSAFVEAHSSLKEKGGLMGAVDRYVGGLEAQDLYRRAVTELALGQQSQAELRLTKIIKEFPDSDVAPKAKKLVDSSDEENEIKVDENDLIIEGETNDPESAPGGSGNKLINTSGTGVGKADKLYAEAMTLYKKAAPNMPNWMTHNKAALRKLDQAIKLYVKAAIRDKDNTKLENRIAEAQRIKYNLKKTQRLD